MSKFSVGDVVTIREWEDMEEEYGVDEDGDICHGYWLFVDGMKDLCGESFEIVAVRNPHDDEGDEIVYNLRGAYDWAFADWMFEESVEIPGEDLDEAFVECLFELIGC